MRILDAQGTALPPEGAALNHAATLDTSALHPGVRTARILLACNTHNVLTGPTGVARIFGPQKGAPPEQTDHLDAALSNWADLLTHTFTPDADLHHGPGTGASGGLGAGLIALGAQAHNRFDVLLDSDNLDELIAAADVVITAEGAIDFQTPRGKVPAEIARRAGDAGVPVLALAGSIGAGAPKVHDIGIGAIASIMTVPMPLEDAVRDSRELLSDAAERTMRLLQLGAAVSARIEEKQRQNLR